MTAAFPSRVHGFHGLETIVLDSLQLQQALFSYVVPKMEGIC